MKLYIGCMHIYIYIIISCWSPIAGANQAFFTQGLVDDVASGDPWLTRISLSTYHIFECHAWFGESREHLDLSMSGSLRDDPSNV